MAIDWTQDDIDALKTAIRRGVRSVTYDGERVEYNSLAEMRELLASMEASVTEADIGSSSMGARRYAVYDSGL